VVDNVSKVLAIELICAAEAAEFRGAEKLAPSTRALFDLVRKLVPPVTTDRSLSKEIEAVASALSRGEFLHAVEEVAGRLY